VAVVRARTPENKGAKLEKATHRELLFTSTAEDRMKSWIQAGYDEGCRKTFSGRTVMRRSEGRVGGLSERAAQGQFWANKAVARGCGSAREGLPRSFAR